ncbi:MAG: hypothetical protein R6U96_02875 [Promethearchaeia archaeon]
MRETSQTKISKRSIICHCGHGMDRDLNSAVNIRPKFLTSAGLLHQPSLREGSFLDRWIVSFMTHSPKICPVANV